MLFHFQFTTRFILEPIFLGGQFKVASKTAIKTGELLYDEGRAVVRTSSSTEAAVEGTGVTTRRISGTHKDLTSQGVKDSHHIIQDAAVRDLPGYDRNAARTVQLDGPSNRIGSEHYLAGQVQRQAGGGTYAAERRIGYKGLRRAGIPEDEARMLIQEADDYFSSIGVGPDTVTRIPGNRRGR